ncbi:GDSL-type esterase/lipase family protein [Sutcliffiella horikoshii]|uniref:GDSL-type esterase/lipase family protein n=1 Tax=Sutcliffiella horikoshii TaxID=79883 RepID=UPI0007D04272|nr:GDSL-type esterase/lipase family protein [Sutcliffiella horikoshii]MCM3619926.1 GDSL-type esterase/lipase family protein [Sutcliffiella horikoshii]
MKIACIGDSLTEGKPGVSFFNMLKKKYPDIKFVNLGKAGETVKSLHTRLTKNKLEQDYDLAFLWIGVNDIYSRLLKVQAQPITRNSEEFREYYESLVDLVLQSSKDVIVVSPAVIGENINSSNRGLLNLSMIIEEISKEHRNATFIDLHQVFTKQLETLHTTDYLSTGVGRLVKDVFFYRSPKRVDRLATERGLHLTIDGVHLNSHGAGVVVDEYAKVIDQFLAQR